MFRKIEFLNKLFILQQKQFPQTCTRRHSFICANLTNIVTDDLLIHSSLITFNYLQGGETTGYRTVNISQPALAMTRQ